MILGKVPKGVQLIMIVFCLTISLFNSSYVINPSFFFLETIVDLIPIEFRPYIIAFEAPPVPKTRAFE